MAQQIYMIEIMVDKVSIFVREDDTDNNTDKEFIVKLKFGPKEEVMFKQTQLTAVQRKDEIVACEDQVFDKKWNRMIRVGKSYLFPSYPDQLVITLGQCPLELEMWTDGKNEEPELIGNGIEKWNAEFYAYLKENDDPKRLHEPLAIKQTFTMFGDGRPGRVAEVDLILRISVLGESIITEYQQIVGKEHFAFRSNKVPTMVKCERIDGDDINFCMVGNIYETITLEDPTVIEKMNQKIEVCTELESCHKHGDNRRIPVDSPLKKIRMGDIVGPCGNKNCVLAHKIKTYLRSLEMYKKETKGKKFDDKSKKEGTNVCGKCGCKDGLWHRPTCPTNSNLPTCAGCGGIAKSGETCEERIKNAHGMGKNPKTSDKKSDTNKDKEIHYLTSITRDFDHKPSPFGQNFIVHPCEITYPVPDLPPIKYCTCQKTADSFTSCDPGPASSSKHMGNISAFVFNADVRTDGKTEEKKVDGKSSGFKFCTDIPDEKDKECKCKPVKMTPPCKTFDCECLTKTQERESRKHHKSFCPLYKHKLTCPVTKMIDEEVNEFEEEEAETLPYGLPPVQLGPCPIIGRPCSVPDGYARMYRTGALPNQPVSYSEAGKICCSKEFERIRKAITEYMKAHEKEDDYRCLNKFYRDTEKRCCDKEQRLLTLLGRSCCGTNKMGAKKP